MINQALHRRPVAADRATHREVRMQRAVTDWSLAGQLNSVFIAGQECGDIAREYPIVFVHAGTEADGTPTVAPIAVLGLVPQQNLFVDNGAWRALTLPLMLQLYPFCIGRLDESSYAVCFDAGWSGVADGSGEGERLFTDEGEPTPYLQRVQGDLETFEVQADRTRQICRRLRELELLREMRFDATLPDGKKLGVEGFLTIDGAKFNALPDATVAELHRNGTLGLVHAHYISLGTMRKLLDWHLQRLPAGA